MAQLQNDDERSQSTSVEFTRAGPHPAFASVGVDPALMGIAPVYATAVAWSVLAGSWLMSILSRL